MYDKYGNLYEDFNPTQDEIDNYNQEKIEFQKQNQLLPVRLVNYCASGHPLWILATPEPFITTSDKLPTRFNPSSLKVSKEAIDELIGFCHQYEIIFDEEPNWWISSFKKI